MNRLRKIAGWIWRNKERMVLAVVVGILVFRVYQVVQPTTGTDDEATIPRPPSSSAPSAPPLSPNIVVQEKPEPRTALLVRNPFVWQAQGGPSTVVDAGSGKPALVLLRTQVRPDGTPEAQIRSGPSRKWYDVGSKFESYELTDIDVANQKIKIYSEEMRKEYEYTKE